MKKTFLLFVILFSGCTTVNIYEFENIMTEEEKKIFFFQPLIYSIDENYINYPFMSVKAEDGGVNICPAEFVTPYKLEPTTALKLSM